MSGVSAEALRKYDILKQILTDMGSAAIAFSGGVDSTFLCRMAHDVLGDKMMAVTASSQSFPTRELESAKAFCESNGIKQVVLEHDELAIEGFKENPANRCYICKHGLFSHLLEVASNNELAFVAEGSNEDDLSDYRPGLQAIKELGVRSPLRESHLTKGEIRELSQMLGLPTWSKPSFACLASRFPYGDEITEEKMDMVGKAEAYLVSLGADQMRVRIHDTIARIEVLPEKIEWIVENREKIVKKFKAYGFTYVTLDLQGYRTGSMNETLTPEQKV